MGDEGVGPRNEFRPSTEGGKKGERPSRPFAYSRTTLHVYAKSIPDSLVEAAGAAGRMITSR